MKFRIGSTNNGEFFNGLIDDVAIWRTPALAGNQISALFTGTSPLTLPPANTGLVAHWVADDLNATLDDGDVLTAGPTALARERAPTGLPQLQKSEIAGHWVVRFTPGDGNDQLRVLAASNPLANQTDFRSPLSFADEAGIGGGTNWSDNTGIIDGTQAGAASDWGLAINSTGQVAAGLGNPDRTLYSSSLLNLADGQPHVAIYTRSGATMSLTVDGLPLINRTDGATTARGNFDMVFGSLATNANYFDGDLAEVRVYNTSLGVTAVDALGDQLMETYESSPRCCRSRRRGNAAGRPSRDRPDRRHADME